MHKEDPRLRKLLDAERRRAENDLARPGVEWGVPDKRLDDYDLNPPGFEEWLKTAPRCESCQRRPAIVNGQCGDCIARNRRDSTG